MLVLPLLAATASLFSLVSAAPTSTADLELAALPLSNVSEPVSEFHSLEKRQKCSKASQCKYNKCPANAYRICKSGMCSFLCNKGYVQKGANCVRTSSSSSSSKKTTSSVKLASTSSSSALSAAGVKSFLGTNSGIASWFRTNSAQDSTNGHSWCYFPYNDNVPGFAISLKTMLNDFGGDAFAAREAYCGLEAIVTAPSGKSMTLVVADAFDDAWVRTPGSMDVVYNAFMKLNGYTTNDKNVVLQPVTWKFTGARNSRYKYNGVGSG
ncbi:hypothetical protein JCM10207_002931 [Rhodosporidiobolus poonsookiae]